MSATQPHQATVADDHSDDDGRGSSHEHGLSGAASNSSVTRDDRAESRPPTEEDALALAQEWYDAVQRHRLDNQDDDNEDDGHDDDGEEDSDDSDEHHHHYVLDAEMDDDDDEYMDAEDGQDDDDEAEWYHNVDDGDDAHDDDDDEDEDEDDDDDDDDEDDEDGPRPAGMGFTGLDRILSLIGARTGLTILNRRQLMAIQSHGLFHGDDEDSIDLWLQQRRRAPPPDPNRFPKVPSEEGRKLMESGVFGVFDMRDPGYNQDKARTKRKQLARRILDRELGVGNETERRTNNRLMAQHMIPSTKAEMVVHYPQPVCCGQFSDDGNFFYACGKDFKVRMYDTSNPYNWRHYKTVNYPFGQWTLTDADLSPDNKWLAYTSLRSLVCLAPTDPNDTGDPYTLDLGDLAGRRPGWGGIPSMPIFSIRFSGDGRQLVAGTAASSIVVYDIERRQSLYHVPGHSDDVNAVCFADKSSPHILYSGSDDCTIKVWDTRSMGDGREAGAFVGHVEGLTYIDSKGDGRYILSNGKDQSMKLWDLRMAMSTAQFAEKDPMKCIRQKPYDYDYRWEDYDSVNHWFKHPHDNSLVTFRGHKVQRTLIRCHFSPPGATDSRYVYSGSQDGYVYVWNLDATLAAKINVKAAVYGGGGGDDDDGRRTYRRLRGGRYHQYRSPWVALVRDVGWHPNAPLLVGEFLYSISFFSHPPFGQDWFTNISCVRAL